MTTGPAIIWHITIAYKRSAVLRERRGPPRIWLYSHHSLAYYCPSLPGQTTTEHTEPANCQANHNGTGTHQQASPLTLSLAPMAGSRVEKLFILSKYCPWAVVAAAKASGNAFDRLSSASSIMRVVRTGVTSRIE